MKRYIVNLLVTTLAVLFVVWVLDWVQIDPGQNKYIVGLKVAFVLSILNAFIRPLMLIFTLPVNILTLGLFTFVINAVVILFADSIVSGFHVAGFWAALFFSILLSLTTTFLESILGIEQ
ncbi:MULTISPECIES: phage holin family protein [Persicobacter]|uniref:Phage holin family protein n=1 Tax=Persicobacter diffluens TaxID=981 RepID=A0AAN4VWY5_9BACT|nr:phage holin family protein [Persicobacter sp. CCB-QB2]GJM61238.1 hypothetical protein PEDI_17900 [Persicobacter diffluens]